MSEQQMTPAPRRIRSFQALRRPAAFPPQPTVALATKTGGIGRSERAVRAERNVEADTRQ
jgi:hypothetical protein